MQISRRELERRIEARFIERGAVYAERGQVVFDAVSPETVTAWVAGTRLYRVALGRDGAPLWLRCTCPAFADWGSCKHVAAVIRALPDHLAGRYEPAAETGQLVIHRAEVAAELAELSREELVEVLFSVAEDDDDILDAMASVAATRALQAPGRS